MSTIQILQQISFDWGVRAFGEEHMTNAPIRALRLVEEAIELCQMAGVNQETLHKQVDAVYVRPVGYSVRQEVGGIMVTLAVFCHILDLDVEKCFAEEVNRVLSKDPKHFAERNKEKLALGLKA